MRCTWSSLECSYKGGTLNRTSGAAFVGGRTPVSGLGQGSQPLEVFAVPPAAGICGIL